MPSVLFESRRILLDSRRRSRKARSSACPSRILVARMSSVSASDSNCATTRSRRIAVSSVGIIARRTAVNTCSGAAASPTAVATSAATACCTESKAASIRAVRSGK
ncbi:Uncharacterised protein [Mycobacteroides abscessus subsp. abscessus]|nr:Uncharacterised protein [Mycobacteroides abscessus subsp. abscessus]